MSSPEFSVIIVSYNSGDYLQGAVSSLARQTYRDFEVVLLDNASKDDAVERLDLAGLDDIQIVRETENHGFARGNNLAAARARGRWLVLLNPDAAAHPDWLSEIAEGIARHPNIRVFACTQYNMDEPEKLDGAGDAYLVFGYPWRGGYLNPVSNLPDEGYCFSPCGASAVFERILFEEIGGFDERFFCYCEDVDIGFRFQMAGERCVFLPKAAVDHKGSGITGPDSYFTTFHGNRNRLWTYVKNMPLPLLFVTFPAHLAILIYIYFRNRPQFEHSGMADGLRKGFESAWSMRRKGDFKSRSWPASWRVLLSSMAWNPFIIGRFPPRVISFGRSKTSSAPPTQAE